VPGARGSPGWYLDPDDATLLRYWTGRSWSHRRRVRPPWTLANAELELDTELPVVEGPAHVDALAANVSPPAVVRPRLSRLHATPSRWDTAWDDPRAAGLGRPPRLPSGRGAWARPRRPLILAGTVLAVALLVVSSTTGLAERGSGRDVTTAFAAEANELCQATLAPTARPATGLRAGAGGSAGAGAGAGSGQGQQAITEVERLGARLSTVASRVDNTPDVTRWVGGWRKWVTDERAYLASSQPSGGAGDQGLARQADLDAQQADRFALANGLRSCLLTPRAAASTIAISQ
jgi:hypothetical protein